MRAIRSGSLGQKMITLIFFATFFPLCALGWPSSGESDLFDLRVPHFDPVAWPSAGESGVFDLTPRLPRFTDAVAYQPYLSGESGIFSLQGIEGTYAFTLSASYSATAMTARVIAYVYDPQKGAVVSSGTGIYRISQGGNTLLNGNLVYSSTNRYWDSSAVSLTATGQCSVLVTVNGQSGWISLQIPSLPPVHLIGVARNGAGATISGATVKLYAAATVLGAADLNNLPAPLATATTLGNGSFDFSDRAVGQYMLVLVTGIGTTIGPAFWLRGGEGTHSETIVENPGRTDLLNHFASLRDSIQTHVVDKQTEWMKRVADTVDADLDGTPDTMDWVLLAGNIVSGSAAGLATASAQSAAAGGTLTASQSAKIIGEKSADSLLRAGVKTAAKIDADLIGSIDGASRVAQGILLQPYYSYSTNSTQERSELWLALTNDVLVLLDPRTPTPFLSMIFSRNNKVRQHSLDWYINLASYRFSQRWLDTYEDQAVLQLPSLPGTFSVARATKLFESASDQLLSLETGSRLLVVGPNANEWSSSGAVYEPLALNLFDYDLKYGVGRTKKQVLSWVSKGSSIVSIGGHTVAACSAAGVISAPAAAPAEVVALVAGGVSLGASLVQAGVMEDMASTYVQMSAKYPANLLTSPLALKRTSDFIISEATAPYYLNSNNQFAGSLGNSSLGGTVILGREAFFPIGLKLLPFMPPIQFTEEKNATLAVTNKAGCMPAGVRVESKVTDFSGTHDHIVISAGQMSAGQNKTLQVPFRGHMTANGILTAGTFETRLWVGPFQKAIKTKDFVVVPINFSLTPGLLASASLKSEMRKPLGFIQMGNQSLTGDQVVDLSNRVRERVEPVLTTGTNSFEKSYTFSNDVFETEIRLYRPPGTKVSLYAMKDGEYIGWDSILSTAHYGYPGTYSGREANPESIKIPNCGGQTITVRAQLDELISEPVPLLLEIWETPFRDAVLVALPDGVDLATRTGSVQGVEIAVGESSHQQPLLGVTVSLTSLRTATGSTLTWTNTSPGMLTNLPAGTVRIYNLAINTSNALSGTYTGAVTVVATNAGTVTVPVSVTVDGAPPHASISPIKEWWHEAAGPLIAWTGMDDISAQSNLLYSVWLEGWDADWSGFNSATSRDLSGVSDGHFIFRVIARDQALNQSPEVAVPIYIDRTNALWRQRIVDANLNDGITNVAQVVWSDDFDLDGVSNQQEYLAGTDPTDPTDRFAIIGVQADSNGIHVRWKAKRGFTYRVLKISSLNSGEWAQAPIGASPLHKSEQIATADGDIEYIDPLPPGGGAFYKVTIVQP